MSLIDDELRGAVQAAEVCAARTTAVEKKRWGQYFSPPEVAVFMASLLKPAQGSPGGSIRVLDPGAGTGLLGLAAAHSLLADGISRVHLVAVEPHPATRRLLQDTLLEATARHGDRLSVEILDLDFLDLAQPRLDTPTPPPFDVAIANPPYFKMSPNDPRGGTAPNIYARFMEIAAHLLKPGGQLAFIIPRSFASGLYFQKFRRHLHDTLALTHVHTFESRRDAFKAQGVLQENVIVRYVKNTPQPASIAVSSSTGAEDLQTRTTLEVPRDLMLRRDDPQRVLRLPSTPEDVALLSTLERWKDTLDSHGLKVSTGPVVPFRATESLTRHPNGAPTAPLLWMQHVRAEGVTWPLGARFRKAEHLLLSATDKLTIPNRTYILLRRFSAKEEARRLTAAVLRAGDLPGDEIGLENHLNFIHRPGGLVDIEEALGLAALLNSPLLDQYFRIVNGNTQVNATDLRALPLPPRDVITELGRKRLERPACPVDALMDEVLLVKNRPDQGDPGRAGDAPPAAKRERHLHPGRDGEHRPGYPLG